MSDGDIRDVDTVIPVKRVLTRAQVDALEAVYAQLPRVECKGLCGHACGPIDVTAAEYERLRAAHPFRLRLRTVAGNACGYLKDGRCSVYRARPTICRIWGTFPGLFCPHGCQPDRVLTVEHFVATLQAVERIGGPMYSSCPGGVFPRGSFLRELKRQPSEVPWQEIVGINAQIQDAQQAVDAFFGKGKIRIEAMEGKDDDD